MKKQQMSHEKKIRYTGAVFLFVLLLCSCGKSANYTTKTIPPTCTEKGYTIYTNVKNGSTRFKDTVDALGHDFGAWENSDGGTNEEIRKCKRCGFADTRKTAIAQEIPSLCLYGDTEGIGKENDVFLSFTYTERKKKFDGYATLKYQGHTSLKYDKKNYTIKFYCDDRYTQKQKVQFNDWNAEHKYILKSTYLDASKIRNLVCADIWSGMVESRENVHPRLLKTSNNGAVDGFPVVLNINDEFMGLYNLTLHKDDDLFLMKDGKKDGILISNEGDFDEALFKKQVDWEAPETWEIEYCGTDNKKRLQNKFNKFLEFVSNSDNKTFKKNLKKYADVPSVIDYMIAAYSLGISNKDREDIIFLTYDNSPWIASLFDMGTAFGRSDDGSAILPIDDKLPNLKTKEYNTENILFIKMLDCFYDEICERYSNLRKNVLSEENLIDTVENRNRQIPPEILNRDFEKYPDAPGKGTADVSQIKEYISDRLKLTDEIFLKGFD